MALAWNTTAKPSQAQSRLRGRDRLGVAVSKTNDLHGKQFALWGWHDMRRKSADQKTSPCRINVKGRCDRRDCCCHWPDQPEHTQQSKIKNFMSHKHADAATTVAALTTVDPRDAPGCKPTERRRVDEARAVETGLTTQLDVHAERRYATRRTRNMRGQRA